MPIVKATYIDSSTCSKVDSYAVPRLLLDISQEWYKHVTTLKFLYEMERSCLPVMVLPCDTSETTVFIPGMVKYTVRFSGRRNIIGTLPTVEGYLLGYNHLGEYDDARDCASRACQDGSSRTINSRVSTTPVSEQTQSTPALVDQNESSDQEEPISKPYNNPMLGKSRNPLWRGHSKGCNSKIP